MQLILVVLEVLENRTIFSKSISNQQVFHVTATNISNNSWRWWQEEQVQPQHLLIPGSNGSNSVFSTITSAGGGGGGGGNSSPGVGRRFWRWKCPTGGSPTILAQVILRL
jgi:hypothetical protein